MSISFRTARPRRSFAAAITVLLAIFAFTMPSMAPAQMVVPLTVEQMAGVAEDVVHGTVVENKTGIHNGKVYTISTIQVHEAFKGSHSRGETMEVVGLGGEVGPVAAMPASLPTLEEAEEVVLFTSNPMTRQRRRADLPAVNENSPFVKHPQVIGGFQGKFRVVRDEVEHELPGDRRVKQTIPRVVRETPGQSVQLSKAPTLDSFATQLRECLNPTVQRRTATEVPTVGEVQVPQANQNSSALRYFDPKGVQDKTRTIKGTVIRSSASPVVEETKTLNADEVKPNKMPSNANKELREQSLNGSNGL